MPFDYAYTKAVYLYTGERVIETKFQDKIFSKSRISLEDHPPILPIP